MTLNVEVLEKSFEQVRKHAKEFSFSFYNNLFKDNPQLQPLFANTNMEAQEQKLMMSLVLVINNLRNLAYLQNVLKDLGARHVQYGTIQQHYPAVGAALLKTLESYLGSDWTLEVKQAWIDAYGAIAGLMLEGATAEEKNLEHQPQQSDQPATREDVLTQETSTTFSQLNLNLLLIIFSIAGLLSMGFFYYQSSWQQENDRKQLQT